MEEYGITSYSMCSSWQTLACSYYLLKEALQYQKPKVLCLETYYLYVSEKIYKEEAVRMAFDGVRLGEEKHEMIQDLLADLSWKDQLSYYLPFLKYHSRWKELKKWDFQSYTWRKGATMDFDVHSMEEPDMPEQGAEIPQNALVYFEKIRDLCDENGITLLLYAAPYGCEEGETEEYLAKQAVNVTLEQYAEEENIPFLFFQKTGEAEIDFSTDFRDATHLNLYGARKITKCLGVYMDAHYDLPDHRQDPDYQSWQEDYESYEAAIKENDAEEIL